MANVVKVLLCEDIERLGWLGDVVEVKTGYARNYLLPQGLALVATEVNVKAIADEKSKRAELRKSERVHLEDWARAAEGAEAVVAAKANEQGHLFGSVTEQQIAANLREQGFEVPDEVVFIGGLPDGKRKLPGGKRKLPGGQLAGHIKEVGTHSVTLRYAEDLSCQVSVVVVAEQTESADPAAETADPAAETADTAGEGADAAGEADETEES